MVNLWASRSHVETYRGERVIQQHDVGVLGLQGPGQRHTGLLPAREGDAPAVWLGEGWWRREDSCSKRVFSRT